MKMHSLLLGSIAAVGLAFATSAALASPLSDNAVIGDLSPGHYSSMNDLGGVLQGGSGLLDNHVFVLGKPVIPLAEPLDVADTMYAIQMIDFDDGIVLLDPATGEKQFCIDSGGHLALSQKMCSLGLDPGSSGGASAGSGHGVPG